MYIVYQSVVLSMVQLFPMEPLTALGVVTMVVGLPSVAYCWVVHKKV